VSAPAHKRQSKEDSTNLAESTTIIKADKPVVPRHALIGIAAVLMAAINSSLGAGLISAGLEDLRGVWGLGIDDAAYITTAFNASQMFMGPIAIILAARFGHRSVLIYGGLVYCLSSLFLPFMPPGPLIYFFLVIGGLASGTFYPLCLSFIGRNLPLSLLPFGVAAYSMDVLASNHVVNSLEGFFLDYVSWKWIFWTPAVFTIPMCICVRKGIPKTPPDQLLPDVSYGEMLYVSGGLTMLYIALDQGERLDWYNNGLINGLAIGGVILLFFAWLRRKIWPHPFIDFSYLKARNILILGLLLGAVRLIILRPVYLIPLFLETLQQYRPPEIGQLLLLSLGPYLVALPVFAYLMRRLHTRVVLTIGFFTMGVVNFHDAHALSTWNANNFVIGQAVGSVAGCVLLLGVMSGTVFEGRLTGAYRNCAGAYCQGVYFQICRLFYTEAAVSALRRLILYRQHYWQTKLVSGLSPGWQFQDRQQYLAAALAPQAAGPLQRPEIAAGLISGSVHREAFTLAMNDSFMSLALVSLICLIAVLMMTPIPLPHQLPDADATPVKSKSG
jgi:DHA2 family multidrug resistance protein